jgi:nitrogen fixation protein NifX
MSMARHLRVLNSGTDDGFLATALKVAFTSTNMKEVDQHFGSAESVAIYAIDMDQARLVEATEFGKLSQDGNEDKLAAKIAALEGCVAVYTNAVGASAVNQLKAKGVQPVKVTSGAAISDLVEALQDELRAGPSAWLARAIDQMNPRDASRFAAMEAEGWDE